MLGLIVNSNYLELGKISISLTFKNPLFSKELFPKVYSYSFNILNTPFNNSVLNQQSQINLIDDVEKYDCKIEFNGYRFLEGYLVVKETHNNKIIVHFESTGLDFEKYIKETKLPQLNLATFNVYDPLEPVNTNKQTAWHNHIQIGGNGVSILHSTHHFAPIKTGNIYGDENNAFVGSVNHYDWFGTTSNGLMYANWSSPVSLGERFRYTFSPCNLALYVIKEVIKQKGFTLIENDFINSEVIQNLIIYSANTIDDVQEQNGNYRNVYAPSYSLQDYLPNTEIDNLFKVFTDVFKTVLTITDNKIEFKPINDIFNTDTEDITRYIEPHFQRKKVTDLNYKFEYSILKDEKHFSESTDFETVLIDKSSTKTETIEFEYCRPLATLKSDFDVPGNIYNNLAKLGLDLVIGKSNYLPDSEPIDKILLGVYRGYIDQYPVYSNITKMDTPTLGNDLVIGKESLSLNGSDGIVENHWMNFINLNSNSVDLKKTLNLSIHQLKKISDFNTPLKSFYHERGNVQGVLTEMQVTLSNKGISPVKAIFKVKK